jgi:hypothetical protein
MKYVLDGREVSREEWLAGAPGFTPGAPPAVVTDATFLQGHVNGSQFEKNPGLGDAYRRRARAAGLDPKGKVYLSGLADSPGDPKAWVSGRADVRKVCEERGWGCQGAVTVKARKDEPCEQGPVDVAPDIVAEGTAAALAAQPGADPAEVRDRVIQRRKPHWKKKGT